MRAVRRLSRLPGDTPRWLLCQRPGLPDRKRERPTGAGDRGPGPQRKARGRGPDRAEAARRRWTQRGTGNHVRVSLDGPEREELQALYDEHGRRDAVRLFVEAYPHRTVEGTRYQIDTRLNRRGS